MRIPRRLAGGITGAAVLLTGSVAVAPAAQAGHHGLGDRSLAALLTADESGFDRNAQDFDIVTAAVLAVLDAKPDSAVGVLADGGATLTAFVPRDGAFRLLVRDLTGTAPASEADVFAAVADLGIDTVETVLLYHVVPGARITGKDAVAADGAELTTAQGGTLTVDVTRRTVRLVDADTDDPNAAVVRTDLNRRNEQIAHVVDHVLRPVDLSPSGERALADLLVDGNRFDTAGKDFDILTEAVLAVLAAKPDSPVAVLTDGSAPLTAFLPTDNAFKVLVRDLTGRAAGSEQATFAAVADLGIDTVEAVLLYHVVPDATISRHQALRADGVALTTAGGGALTVDVTPRHRIMLTDLDPDDDDATVVRADINRGNVQIAHGVSRVLRPLDL